MSEDVLEEDGEIENPRIESTLARDESTNNVKLGQYIDINSAKPLPEFDIGEVKAYQALGHDRKAGPLIAYVCERHIVPRMQMRQTYGDFLSPCLLKLADQGVVYWPPTGEERYVFAYNNNVGDRILPFDAPPALGLKQDLVMSNFVVPMIEALQEFQGRDFFHGHINPHNLFYGLSKETDPFVLGECLTCPPGFHQLILYETVERACMDPIAKGRGSMVDDLYALSTHSFNFFQQRPRINHHAIPDNRKL